MQTFTDATFAEHAAQGLEFGPGQDRQPSIVPHHIDGPLLYFSDGQLHWLTIWERILFHFGWTDAERLQRKLRPRLTAELQKAPSR